MTAVAWVPHTVSTQNTPDGGSWSSNSQLRCRDLSRFVGRQIDQATLYFSYGTIDGAYVAPIDLQGKFVRIEAAGIDWVGYVLGERKTRWSQEDDGGGTQRVSGGDQVFAVVGLEWFLGRKTIHGDRVATSGGTTTIERAIGFNMGAGDGRQVEVADSYNKSTAGEYFELGKTLRGAWSIGAAVRYLLSVHRPEDKDGNAEPAVFAETINATIAAYLNAQPTQPIRTEGRSVLQVLDALLSTARGLTWWWEWNEFSTELQLKASTQAVSNVSLPGGLTLPAAITQSSLDVDGLSAVRACEISKDYSRNYSRVVCRGARRRSVFSVSFDSSTLEEGWSAAQETDYVGGASSKPGYGGLTAEQQKRDNDRYRERAELERVYQVFRIPIDWDGRSNDGSSGGTKEFACPSFPQGSSSIFGSEPLGMTGFRLLPTTPLRVGWDYTNATAPVDNGGSFHHEYERPFAVIDAGDASAEWRFTHKLNTTNEETSGGGRTRHKTAYRLRTIAGEPAFQLSPGGALPHAMAKGHYDTASPEPSNYETEVDYDTLRATVCGEWDSYCQAQAPLASPADDPLDTLYIDIGERARLDYLAEGTIWDCSDGELKTVSTGGILRDDRDLCEQVATIAKQWYDEDRAQVAIRQDVIAVPAALGALITSIGTAAAAETVNAVVMKLMHDFRNGATILSAGFTDLDFRVV